MCVRAVGGRRKENAARMFYARAELVHAFFFLFLFESESACVP